MTEQLQKANVFRGGVQTGTYADPPDPSKGPQGTSAQGWWSSLAGALTKAFSKKTPQVPSTPKAQAPSEAFERVNKFLKGLPNPNDPSRVLETPEGYKDPQKLGRIYDELDAYSMDNQSKLRQTSGNLSPTEQALRDLEFQKQQNAALGELRAGDKSASHPFGGNFQGQAQHNPVVVPPVLEQSNPRGFPSPAPIQGVNVKSPTRNILPAKTLVAPESGVPFSGGMEKQPVYEGPTRNVGPAVKPPMPK